MSKLPLIRRLDTIFTVRAKANFPVSNGHVIGLLNLGKQEAC